MQEKLAVRIIDSQRWKWKEFSCNQVTVGLSRLATNERSTRFGATKRNNFSVFNLVATLVAGLVDLLGCDVQNQLGGRKGKDVNVRYIMVENVPTL